MPSKKTLDCSIVSPAIQYSIVIGNKLMDEALSYAKTLSHQCLIITTDGVNSILPKMDVAKLVLPSGESIKSRAIKEKIEDALIERGWGRECCLIAIGGGAVLDLTGFVAATYCRGISYISMPTTLLAMTDAAIGGKTGVNVEEAKNWIGAFHHPRKIFIDLAMLNSLPEREYLYGLSETIKHSLIADKTLFALLETEVERILKRDTYLMSELVFRSCMIKKQIIEKDPFEKEGRRRVLNFGHTFAHAIETLSEYRCPHGQAVIMGIRLEAELSHRMDYLSKAALNRIETLLQRYAFKMDFPKFFPFEMLKRDKKGAYRMVVLTSIGTVAPFDGDYTVSLSKKQVEKAWFDVVCNAKVLQ